MMLINGKETDSISAYDRGLAYGDGFFETLAIVNGEIHNWELHLKRIKSSAIRLKFPELDQGLILSSLKKLISNSLLNNLLPNNNLRFIVKLIITRGEGKRGYQLPTKPEVTYILMNSEWPNFPRQHYLQGVDIKELSMRIANQSVLAGIKHLNRLEQVMAQSELTDEYQEGLLLNNDNQPISAISGNLYFYNNKVLYVLNQKNCGISGTIREQVIQLSEELDVSISFDLTSLDKLLYSSEVFISNSIRGLWPIKSITLLSGKIQNYKPGKIYQLLSERINHELGYTCSI